MERQLLIAGLDGATWTVLDPLLATGRVPTLANLITRGSKHSLRSTIPPISSAAWVTMMSGMNPGQHGVFDFRNLDLSQYTAHDERLANAGSYSVPTLFDYLSQANLTSIAYQVPMTYPPWPIRGQMVAGYPTPDHQRAYTWPPELAGSLGRLYTHSPDQIGAATPAGQASIYHRYISTMTDQLIQLSRGSWDLLMFVNGATDGAQHRFFKFTRPGFPGVSPAEQQQHGHLLDDIMIAADAELGRLLAALPADLDILVISDHGAMPRPGQAFNLNAWLAREGWLNLRAGASATRRRSQQLVEWAKQTLPITDWAKRRLPARFKQQLTSLRSGVGSIDWPRTQAYRVKLSHPIEGIHLNLQGRQPAGVVPTTDYEPLRQEIIARLRTRPEILAVCPREAAYHGPHLANAPDILLQLQPDFDGGADLAEIVTPIPAGWLQSISGYHDLDGILVAAGPSFVPQAALAQQPQLQDITPTVLHLLGQPVPANMDGRVLLPLLASSRPVVVSSPLPNTPAGDNQLSPDEEAGIAAALRDLGYIE